MASATTGPLPSPPIDESNHPNPASNSNRYNEDDGDGPTLSLSLEQDADRKDHLFSFRSSSPAPQPLKVYRPSEQQLLQEGKLGESEFSARLKKVNFGRFTIDGAEGVPACLILVKVDFVPKNRGWFRFREATIEAAFTEGKGGKDTGNEKDDDDDDDEDDDDEDSYTGPLVLKFYPEVIRGHTQTASERYNISLSVPIRPPVAGGGISAGISGAWTKEGLHLLHGRLMGDPETRVKWKLHENEVVKSGVYEQPVLAIIVRHSNEPFTMALTIKATTYGGIPVTGKGGARITFKPGKYAKSAVAGTLQPSMAGLAGGSIEVAGQTWGAKQSVSEEPSEDDLNAIDLDTLTGMRAALLGAQGPGSGVVPAES